MSLNLAQLIASISGEGGVIMMHRVEMRTGFTQINASSSTSEEELEGGGSPT